MTHIVKFSVQKFQVEKNMAGGETSCQNRRKEDIIGKHLPDVFMDSYLEDRFACHDIISKLDDCETPFVKMTIDKKFLERITRSHIWMIKEFEKGMTGITYAK